MAQTPPQALLCILGTVIWGDLGPLTLYRSKRGKVIVFAKTWPKKPASPAQQIQRDRMASAALAWRSLSNPQRAQWELATKRASLCCHGYDLYVHWHMSQDDAAIQTLERQTATELLP